MIIYMEQNSQKCLFIVSAFRHLAWIYRNIKVRDCSCDRNRTKYDHEILEQREETGKRGVMRKRGEQGKWNGGIGSKTFVRLKNVICKGD